MYSHIQLTSQSEYQEAINTSEVLLLGQSNIDLGLNFDPWTLTTGQLCGVVLSLFKKLDLVDFMGITDMDLLHFITDVERGYFANPYHSFNHAVDVSVMVYHFLANCSASAYLEQDDILALLIASLCHDVGHVS
jgi:HD-GYP domain-containing protein (c-di-GMP phosphodiesterase class II)